MRDMLPAGALPCWAWRLAALLLLCGAAEAQVRALLAPSLNCPIETPVNVEEEGQRLNRVGTGRCC